MTQSTKRNHSEPLERHFWLTITDQGLKSVLIDKYLYGLSNNIKFFILLTIFFLRQMFSIMDDASCNSFSTIYFFLDSMMVTVSRCCPKQWQRYFSHKAILAHSTVQIPRLMTLKIYFGWTFNSNKKGRILFIWNWGLSIVIRMRLW